MLYFKNFRLRREKTIVIFEISTLQFVKRQSFMQKCLVLVFFNWNFKNYARISNQLFQISQTVIFHSKIKKTVSLGPKLVYFDVSKM